jgi:hypothetical protein
MTPYTPRPYTCPAKVCQLLSLAEGTGEGLKGFRLGAEGRNSESDISKTSALLPST